MKYILRVNGSSYAVQKTDASAEMVASIRRGEYPGLVTFDVPRGSVTVNLSESVAFVLEGDEFPEPGAKPRAAVLS